MHWFWKRSRQRIIQCILVFSPMLAGCNALKVLPAGFKKEAGVGRDDGTALPADHSFRVSQFLFHTDFGVDRDLPLFRELAELRETIVQELRLPPSQTLIKVYLFQDRWAYESFMKARYPELPNRRAFFVAQPHSVGSGEDLLVFTHWGDKIRQDLRHELTHATLHSVLREVPLWLDEGLAEYFEVSPYLEGLNPAHMDAVITQIDGGHKPNLYLLENLKEVSEMSPQRYKEAWAWVHFLLRGSPANKAILIAHLRDLMQNPTGARPLGPKVESAIPDAPAALAAHLRKAAIARLGTPLKKEIQTATGRADDPE